MDKEFKKFRAKLLLYVLGLDVQSVASRLGLARETVSRVVNYDRPAATAAGQVAEFLGEEAKRLITGADAPA